MAHIKACRRQCITKHSILRVALYHLRNGLINHIQSPSSRIADLHIINRNILYTARFHTGYRTSYQAFGSCYNVADIYILQYTTFFPVSAISVSQTDEYRSLDIAHRNIGNGDAINNTSINHFYGNTRNNGNIGRNMFKLFTPMTNIIFRCPTNDTIGNRNIPVSSMRSCTEFDCITIACCDTIRNRYVLAKFRMVTLETNGVIFHINVAIRYSRILGINIEPVIIIITMAEYL